MSRWCPLVPVGASAYDSLTNRYQGVPVELEPAKGSGPHPRPRAVRNSRRVPETHELVATCDAWSRVRFERLRL